ncbi:MAG: UDP-N-acetylglucosamine 1-carboxyvinyltransferase, partial [Oscillospiraceae bacterium]|nr:UDP-N-acetylglucosamine 1-carboxyvinyltransferase [Oscillospiraceae bacterium]
MTKYVIHGGHRLCGTVNISGAKNSAVAILPAALLVSGICRVENVPDISDVNTLLEILSGMGARVRWLSRSELEIDATAVRDCTPPEDLVGRIRASYYLLGSLLGRFGHARVAMPGGCNFSLRP